MSAHPDDKTLRLFAVGRLTEEQGDEIEAHLADCEPCARRLDEIERKKNDPLIREMKVAGNAEPSDDFVPGSLLGGQYRLEKQLGRGGMGVAWKAWEETAQRHVVLKFISKDVLHFSEATSGVRESFHKVHVLQHSHICPLYGLLDDPKHGLYLVMKFIDGLPLDAYCRKNGPIPFDETIRILRAVADALDYAHGRKVIHRDVKPVNIMVGEADGAQLIDFGLADEIRQTLTRTEEVSISKITGTRSYMAPEQWEGRKQDARTDQYALAVTAYELLSGHVPFSGNDTEVLRKCVLTTPPAPIPDLPGHVNAALFRGLAKRREDRFESCRAFVEALAQPSGTKTEPPRLPPPLPSAKAKPTPWKWGAPAIIASILILSVFGFFLIRQPWKSDITPGAVVDVKQSIDTEAKLPVNADAFVGTDSNIESPNTKEPLFEPEKYPSNLYIERENIAKFGPLSLSWRKNGIDTPSPQSVSFIVPTRKPVGKFDVIRVTVEISKMEKNNGRVTVTRGQSTDPLNGFSGTPFKSCSFRNAELFHGQLGSGRILFIGGDTSTKSPTTRPFGWEYWQYGNTRNQWPKSVQFITSPNEERAGIRIGKKGGLPCRITFEIIEKYINDDFPNLEVMLYSDYEQDSKAAMITCWGHKDKDGRLCVWIDFSHRLAWKERIFIAEGSTIEKGGTFAKSFQLPSEIAQDIEMVKYDLWVKRSDMDSSEKQFNLALLDIVGGFKGSAGFDIEERGYMSLVRTVDPNGPAAGLEQGTAIISINGQGGTASDLRKILATLRFGDVVEVRTSNNSRENNSVTHQFCAE